MVNPIFKEGVACYTTLASVGAAFASMALDTPIGLPGAVVLGTARTISQHFIIQKGIDYLHRCPNLSNAASLAAVIVLSVAGLFASSMIAWQALAVVGVALTFKQVVVLSLATNFARQAIVITRDFAALTIKAWQKTQITDEQVNARVAIFYSNLA